MPNSLSASEYILDNFKRKDRIAVLIRDRSTGEVVQRISSAEKVAGRDFQEWLTAKNQSGFDIYIGMNTLKDGAHRRMKRDIYEIKHVYLDLDHGGPEALSSVENSSSVPKPNYILASSPGKFQIAWKVEGMTLDEAEALLHAMAREFGGDPAATDATRVLRLPGFANKKYGTDFYVEVRRGSTETYHLCDFKPHIDSQDSPRWNYNSRAKCQLSTRTSLSQSEYDWAFAKRALARGEEPEEVIRQIAQHRASDKSDPKDYARRTVTKAQLS
jgi:RepB DNA-primase from phage plasmid